MGIDQQAKEYKLLDRFELEDVTVVGSEEGQLKYGFEILSSRKSFAVYSGSSTLPFIHLVFDWNL